MIELIFSVCFIDNPERCREERLSIFQSTITPRQCMMMGQIGNCKVDGRPSELRAQEVVVPSGRTNRENLMVDLVVSQAYATPTANAS